MQCQQVSVRCVVGYLIAADLLLASMNRLVEEEIKLDDGTILPKGARIMVDANTFMDPKVYPDPIKFDPFRFVRLRQQPGQENNYQFVATTPEHMVFGHGQHACPGRFFASNEVKIALCQMLLKYDWKRSHHLQSFT